LKKQSQCQNRQCGINSAIVKTYVCFGGFGQLWVTKNKAKQSQFDIFLEVFYKI